MYLFVYLFASCSTLPVSVSRVRKFPKDSRCLESALKAILFLSWLAIFLFLHANYLICFSNKCFVRGLQVLNCDYESGNSFVWGRSLRPDQSILVNKRLRCDCDTYGSLGWTACLLGPIIVNFISTKSHIISVSRLSDLERWAVWILLKKCLNEGCRKTLDMM